MSCTSDLAFRRHVDAKLVPMASGQGGSEYSLMEGVRPESDDDADEGMESENQDETKKEEEEESWGDSGRCLLRLTSFSCRAWQGWQTHGHGSCLARSYEMS